MNRIITNTDVGRKNILFSIVLFLILGVAVGIPLTVDFLGGSILSAAQYQTWKVLHGYGVFLAFVNFFFGYCIDRMYLTRRQKEMASWSFLIAGLFGGFVRSGLFLLSIQGELGSSAASLIETAGFVLGTFIFMRGKIKERSAHQLEHPTTMASGLL